MWMGACVTGFATNRRQSVSGMQPQSAENHKYVCMYVCLHHGKYPNVLNPVPCKELGFINWAIQCTSTNAAFCQTKVEECQCILYLISLPSCLTAPLVASSCQCCPSSHPSHHLLAPGLCQLEQTRQGTPQSQSSERVIKTKGYTMPIHSYVCTYVSMCHYKYRMFVDTQLHYAHVHRYSQSTSSLGYCWTAVTGRLSV